MLNKELCLHHKAKTAPAKKSQALFFFNHFSFFAVSSFTSLSLITPQLLHFPGLQRASATAPHSPHFHTAIY
jgi:hypothetical protein